jgi:aspartyl-tRNA(Asn)/glutamyl-tRNA(Gln) amidotransferase subunit A
MTDDPALLPATEMVARFRDRRLSPVEVATACLDRIAALDPRLNAVNRVDRDGALAAARASEARWAEGRAIVDRFGHSVDGVPTTLKDIVLAKGWPTLRGSTTIDPAGPWTEDSPAAASLRAGGAVLIGRTTTPEFGWKGVTDSALTGITRNPWNPETTPGGSSGGGAAAAATGMAALNLGTDGGGSVRIPAGFTGVVGMKPSFGRIPAWPPSPFGTVSHIGPMTRTVADTALMIQVMSRRDSRDWSALPFAEEDLSRDLDRGVAGLRLAFAPTLMGADVDPEIAESVAVAVQAFVDLGATVEAADPPLDDADTIFFKHWSVGAATLLSDFPAEKKAAVDPGLVAIAQAGAAIPLLDYTRATVARGRMGVAMNAFHQTYDLLLTPTLPIPAFAAGHEVPPDGPYRGWQDWTPFSYPFNLTQQPAITVPCGLTRAGLPIGLQIVGPQFDDARVLRAAAAFERARPWPLPPMAAMA